ncbi:MAG: FHA domain-containing protein [Bradymonadia bacterium]
MLICQNCSAENEDHYRFCLACGSELAKQEAARIVERPSRPGGREEAKRPQINDLKNRLQALRVSRDANGVSEHDSVDLDRDAPLPGWTKPPMVVAPVTGSSNEPGSESGHGPDDSVPTESVDGETGKVPDVENSTAQSGDEAAEIAREDDASSQGPNGGQPSSEDGSEGLQTTGDGNESDAVAGDEIAGSNVASAESSASHADTENDASDVTHGVNAEEQNRVENTTDVLSQDEAKSPANASVEDFDAPEDSPIDEVDVPANDGDGTIVDPPAEANSAPPSDGENEIGDEQSGSTQESSGTVIESLTGSSRTPSVEFDSDGLALTQPAMERLKLNISDIPAQLPPMERESVTGVGLNEELDAGDESQAGSATETEALRSTQANEVVSQAEVSCQNCGKRQPATFRFCGACGASLEGAQAATSDQPSSIGVLTLIHSDGSEGETFDLGDGNLVIGREHTFGQFADDSCLSPVHVEVAYQDGWLTFKDLNSKNGVFVRLRGETRLSDGERFRIGQRLFRFESITSRYLDLKPAADGTHQLGSPASGHWGRLICIGADGQDSQAWMLTTPEIYLGRDRGTICFPDDVFVSGSHCRLRRDGQSATISDLSSTNGTYVESKGDFAAATGDLILLGQKLYRVDLATE